MKLMTVHAAKGPGSPYVFLCGMNGDLPRWKVHPSGSGEMEEERRLALWRLHGQRRAVPVRGGRDEFRLTPPPFPFLLDMGTFIPYRSPRGRAC